MSRLVLTAVVLGLFAVYSCNACCCRGGSRDKVTTITDCSDFTEPTCSEPEPMEKTKKPVSCNIQVCRCKAGYYRSENNHRCVTKRECELPKYKMSIATTSKPGLSYTQPDTTMYAGIAPKDPNASVSGPKLGRMQPLQSTSPQKACTNGSLITANIDIHV